MTQPILVMESPGHLKMEMAIFQPLPLTHTHTHTDALYINYPKHLQEGRLAEELCKVVLRSFGRKEKVFLSIRLDSGFRTVLLSRIQLGNTPTPQE